MSAEFALFLCTIVFLSLWATWTLGYRAGYEQAHDDIAEKFRKRAMDEADAEAEND
jgi:hypothetical protein